MLSFRCIIAELPVTAATVCPECRAEEVSNSPRHWVDGVRPCNVVASGLVVLGGYGG